MSTFPTQVQVAAPILPHLSPCLTSRDPSSGIQVSTHSLPCSMHDRADSPTPQNRPYPSWVSISSDKSSVAQHRQPSAPLLSAILHLHTALTQHRTEDEAPGTREPPGSV